MTCIVVEEIYDYRRDRCREQSVVLMCRMTLPTYLCAVTFNLVGCNRGGKALATMLRLVQC